MKVNTEFPVPEFFHPSKVDQVWRVPYLDCADRAEGWARDHDIGPAGMDKFRICLMLVDVQNTFCIPGFELFVGKGAVEDNIRLCRFIYRNLGIITQIVVTMDTHKAMQIFHPIFINEAGEHPLPATLITLKDIEDGKWKANPAAAEGIFSGDYNTLQRYLLHYVKRLSESHKYDLTVWPYHAMLGGIGHALVSSVEEACFFHNIARQSQTIFEIKGDNPLTENYSALSPEVLDSYDGKPVAEKNTRLIEMLCKFDMIIVAGQAKSHCVEWTVDDLLSDSKLAEKVYLLEDCTSPVVIPGVIDYTEMADRAFERFAAAGIHIVRSIDPIASWQNY